MHRMSNEFWINVIISQRVCVPSMDNGGKVLCHSVTHPWVDALDRLPELSYQLILVCHLRSTSLTSVIGSKSGSTVIVRAQTEMPEVIDPDPLGARFRHL